ncbi:MAG: sigma-70 family RNA polymerase sigma factor [Gammaproteobacteria bacterium]|nr:sigma-70 family RNA polymerase sigma factor [Gammaproteobacteria bacterium]
MEDERQIIERILAGSELAFRQIVDQHSQRIFNYVRRMTRNSAEAEDISQETFIRFWVSRDRFDPGRVKLTTWLHRIAHNLCVDYFRQRQLQERPAPVQPDRQDSPDTEYELSIRAGVVHKALMSLSERQRSAIVLCHYQNFSQRDAAHILDLSVDALESLLRRGRRKLKQKLAKELE